LYYLNPQLEEKELDELYSEAYFSSEDSAVSGYDNYTSDKENIILTSHRKLKVIEKFLPHKGELLDIGCAAGFFLLAARQRNWKVKGVEYCDYVAEIGRESYNLEITTGTLETANYEDNQFDCVTMWDLIEHLPNPMGSLADVNRVLKPGGILAIMTPNVDSLIAKIWGRKWLLWNRTDHMFFFSPKTLNKMLEKNGFNVVLLKKIGLGGKYVSIDFIFSRLIKYSKSLFSFFRNFVNKIGIGKVTIFADWGDNFVVLARKANNK